MTMQNILNQYFEGESAKDETTVFLLLIIFGGGLYGATLGLWRSPLQALFVAIKFPLLIILTTLGTGLINGMLAQLLGAELSFRGCFKVVVRSYALMIIILDSFVPLSLFLLYNLPPMGSDSASMGHSVFLVAHVALISFAGVLAFIHLFGSLSIVCDTPAKALRILFSWLGINMFLGCQLSWNLRPFFGTPSLPVHFIRDHPFENSFYEAVFSIVVSMLK